MILHHLYNNLNLNRIINTSISHPWPQFTGNSGGSGEIRQSQEGFHFQTSPLENCHVSQHHPERFPTWPYDITSWCHDCHHQVTMLGTPTVPTTAYSINMRLAQYEDPSRPLKYASQRSERNSLQSRKVTRGAVARCGWAPEKALKQVWSCALILRTSFFICEGIHSF